MSDLGAFRGATESVESVCESVKAIETGIDAAIAKQLAAIPDEVRQDPRKREERRREITRAVRAAALDAADAILAKENFYERTSIGSGGFLSPNYLEQWKRERCAARLPWPTDANTPTREQLATKLHSLPVAALVGLLDDEMRAAARPVVALEINNAIVTRAARADATAEDRKQAARAEAIVQTIRLRDADEADEYRRRMSSSVKMVDYLRGAIKGSRNPILLAQAAAHRRVA